MPDDDAIRPFDIASSELADHKGLFLGDLHGDLCIPEWLIKHMAAFQEQGVEHFYMEMVRSDHQFLIDDYYEDKEMAEDTLKAYLDERWGRKSPGAGMAYFCIIKAAKENDIKVYGIDNNIGGKYRLLLSNAHWDGVISAHNKKLSAHGKFLVFGGCHHSANKPGDIGIDSMQGIPSIDFDIPKNARISDHQKDKAIIEKGDGKENHYNISLPESPNQRGMFEKKPAEQYQYERPEGIKLPDMTEIIINELLDTSDTEKAPEIDTPDFNN